MTDERERHRDREIWDTALHYARVAMAYELQRLGVHPGTIAEALVSTGVDDYVVKLFAKQLDDAEEGDEPVS